MIKRLKIAVLTAATSLLAFSTLGLAVASALPSSAPVFAVSSHAAACAGLTEIDASQDCNNNGSGVTKVIGDIVTILSVIVGMIAVIVILLSGFKYITSAGDTAKVASAKSTIIYALVGVAIAATAATLIHFAVGTASDATLCHDGIKGHGHLQATDPACKN